MAKDRTATEKLSLSLASLDCALTVMTSMAPEDGPLPGLIKSAREYADRAQEHLLTIQFHLSQLR
jgi:hypothetical protein